MADREIADREVEVIVGVAGADVLAGRLWCHRRRGTESQTFSYAGGSTSAWRAPG